MRIKVELEDGMLPDRFGKHAPAEYQIDGHAVRSFPIEIEDVPEGARTLALAFVDFDAVPVGGFCWIHWLACNFPADARLIPENASASGRCPACRGRTATGRPWRARTPIRASCAATPVRARLMRPRLHPRRVCARLRADLAEGYFLNEFRRAIRGHVLAKATLELPSRA